MSTPETDPLAVERFRTILADALGQAANEEDGYVDPEALADEFLPSFPGARFERTVNPAGVRVRRLVVVTDWEVDPDQAAPDQQPTCPVVTGPCPGDDRGVICATGCRTADR